MKNLYLITALALLASPALAGITPEEVVVSWHKAFDRIQIDLTIGGKTYDGNVLVLSNLQLNQRMPTGNSSPVMEWVRLTPLPDGSVSIALSRTENAGTTMTFPADPNTQITTRSHYDNLALLASGSPEKVTYDLSADRLQFDQTYDGIPFSDVITSTSSDIAMQYSQWEDANGEFRAEGQFSMGSIAIEWARTVIYSSDINNGKVIGRGQVTLSSLTLPFEMTAPPTYFTNLNQPFKGLPDGLTMDMQIRATQALLHMNGGDVDPDFTLDMRSFDPEIAMNVGESSLRYLFDFPQIAATSNNPTFPEQVLTLDLDRILMDISMPFRKSTTASPFSLAVLLENLVIAPVAWDIFDPNVEMLRLPASLDLLVTGQANMLVDVFNADEVNSLTGSPVMLHSLTLERFDIQAENARVTGGGGILVDTDSISSATGRPEFTGVVNINLTGALAFLDRVGRLPNMDPMIAIGAKGALGMFATPNASPDSFTSRIEFTEGGHVSVNGQQVK